MTGFRPKRSAKTEEIGDAMRANNAVHDVIADLSREFSGRSESEVSMDTKVAEMTPVSSYKL